jgi:hypothetical protein
MINVLEFTVISLEKTEKEGTKSVVIKPHDGGAFWFLQQKDLEEFKDELRQTFESVFCFGCSVEALIDFPF